jgi:predicted transcriptional regulator
MEENTYDQGQGYAGEPSGTSKASLVELTTDIVSAYVSNSQVHLEQINTLIRTVHDSLMSLAKPTCKSIKMIAKNPPPCSIEDSVQPDYLICLEDGKHLQVLKRHLKTSFGMSVEEYKRRWGLPDDYPTVAPNYSRRRSSIAKDAGLGYAPKKKRKKIGMEASAVG